MIFSSVCIYIQSIYVYRIVHRCKFFLTWLIGYEYKIEASMWMTVSNTYENARQKRTNKKDKIKKKIPLPKKIYQLNCMYRSYINFFTSCSTSIGISRTPLFIGELNGLWDRLGDNERSTDDGNRGPTVDPLLVLFAVSGSGDSGISTIGLGDRCECKSLCCCVRNTLCIGHFFDMISIFVIESSQIELNPTSITKLDKREFSQYVDLRTKNETTTTTTTTKNDKKTKRKFRAFKLIQSLR